jgi:hypothetical protein
MWQLVESGSKRGVGHKKQIGLYIPCGKVMKMTNMAFTVGCQNEIVQRDVFPVLH